MALVSTVISYGIRTGLADTKAAPAAGMISRLVSEPLAAMLVDTSGACMALQHKIINTALKRMGKTPYDDADQNLFIARLVSKFSGSLLAEIERKESHTLGAISSRDPSYVQHASV